MQRTRLTRRLAPWCAVTVTALISHAVVIGAPAFAGVITSHAVINEIVANPATGEAWVEIYNPTGSTVTICQVSDDDGNQTTGCDNMISTFLVRSINPDFLDDGGDTITLHGGIGVLDTVTYPALGPGQSYARTFDGSTEWEIRPEAGVTRNASNGVVPDDSTPPALAVSSPVTGGTYAGGFTAIYSASDPVAGVLRVAFYLRDGASSGPYDWTGTDINTADQEPFASIEDFGALAPGTYDLCVTAIDRLGNGAPATIDPIPTCDDTSSAVVAVDDFIVTESTTPPGDPAITLTSPPDGTVTDDGTPALSWTIAIDPGFTVIGRQLILSTSADFAATPVSYAPTGDSFTLPDPFGASADATWYWKVVLTYARTPTSPDEIAESPAWTFTVDRDGLPGAGSADVTDPPAPGPADPAAMTSPTGVTSLTTALDAGSPVGATDALDNAGATETVQDYRVLAVTGVSGVYTLVVIAALLLATGAMTMTWRRSSDSD